MSATSALSIPKEALLKVLRNLETSERREDPAVAGLKRRILLRLAELDK
jgi:hypothetical protein